MSLHFIGIRDFPILHRQFSSPTTKVDSPESDRDLARDSKDVLIQRLNDLAYHLMIEENLEDEDITALHVDVDRMENIIKHPRAIHQEGILKGARSPSIMNTPHSHEEDMFWGPFSPSRKVDMQLSTSVSQPSDPDRTSSHNSELLAHEAKTLMESLVITAAELKARKEETDHIHDLLITRAEKAAQRVIELEERVKELDADFEDCQSELSYLRLELKALEVQGMEYISFDADEDLSQSIKNWKLDWADVDQRTKSKRRKCKDTLKDLNDSTVIDSV